MGVGVVALETEALVAEVVELRDVDFSYPGAEAPVLHDVSFTARPGNEAHDSRPALADLAGEVDAISLHCPLNEATHHLVGEALLARLRPDTLLVNCARGGIIDEAAALRALREGRLGGLGVDVLPQEPPREGHPLIDALGESLNLVVTPHNAWITPEARANVVRLTVQNLRSLTT